MQFSVLDNDARLVILQEPRFKEVPKHVISLNNTKGILILLI